METRLSPDLQSVVDLVRDNPGHAGSMRGLLAMLEQVPDAGMAVAALSQMDEPEQYDTAVRNRVADMLDAADAIDEAEVWRPVVVPLSVVRTVDDRQFAPVGPKIGFDDIGGLEKVKKRIRRRIIEPFKNDGLFKAFKRKAGGGVLLYGPPGCGKTMLARALAHECGAVFIAVHPADVIDSHWGASEKAIRNLFAEARHARPAVIFFDEVEALAQKRNYDKHSNFLSTMISTLLTEMDGFEGDNEGLLFLGATNVPWAIDSAFRRPGRFDRTLFVPPPDKVARRFILEKLLEGRPVSPSLPLAAVVERSSGYSGADLAGLVETAVDFAIDESTSVDDLAPLSTEHFQEAFDDTRSTTGEWLAEARNYVDFANGERLYDELADFLKRYTR